ncbi:MAG: transmembrane 220 family protein [Thermoanaerobaculia bacterium]
MAERFWTLTNGIMLLMFLFSVAVQFNDPDPLPWVGIYGVAAAVCGLEIRRRAPAWAPGAIGLIALVWAGTLYYRAREVSISALFAEWEMRDLRVEEAREMYGLIIVAIWMITIVAAAYMRRRPKDAT